jgi:hypothetical protein
MINHCRLEKRAHMLCNNTTCVPLPSSCHPSLAVPSLLLPHFPCRPFWPTQPDGTETEHPVGHRHVAIIRYHYNHLHQEKLRPQRRRRQIRWVWLRDVLRSLPSRLNGLVSACQWASQAGVSCLPRAARRSARRPTAEVSASLKTNGILIRVDLEVVKHGMMESQSL